MIFMTLDLQNDTKPSNFQAQILFQSFCSLVAACGFQMGAFCSFAFKLLSEVLCFVIFTSGQVKYCPHFQLSENSILTTQGHIYTFDKSKHES